MTAPRHARARLAQSIALDPEDDRLLTQAARERGVSRSEFVAAFAGMLSDFTR